MSVLKNGETVTITFPKKYLKDNSVKQIVDSIRLRALEYYTKAKQSELQKGIVKNKPL